MMKLDFFAFSSVRNDMVVLPFFLGFFGMTFLTWLAWDGIMLTHELSLLMKVFTYFSSSLHRVAGGFSFSVESVRPFWI